MKTKIERAAEIHRTMTPHQMALRIVELQDALELAEEAVLAKQPEAPECWQLVPVEPTPEMLVAIGGAKPRYKAMLAAAPKHEGGAV